MLENLLKNEEFQDMMQDHVEDCLKLLLKLDEEFSIMVKLSDVNFNPELPKNISSSFKMPVIVFALANYTLENAYLSKNELVFEAGFGEENFATTLTIPFSSIIQIMVKDSPILLNFAIKDDISESKKREKSKNIFSNLS